MRQKRAKAYRKLMHVYCMSFGFRQPYQVLVDSEMCLEAVSSKIDLAKQLAVVLQGTVKPMITQCCVHQLYIAGQTAQPAVDLARTFERRRCNHREAIPEEECMKEVVGPTNKHRYSLAAQSSLIRQNARRIPGAPLIHIKRSVMVLEPASEASEREKSLIETQRMKPSEAESSNITATLGKSITVADPPPKQKKRGPKGPNPLSVKKKRTKDNRRRPQQKSSQEQTQTAGLKRKHDSEDEDSDDGEDNGDSQHQEKATDDRPSSQTTFKRTRRRIRMRKRSGLAQIEGRQTDHAEAVNA